MSPSPNIHRSIQRAFLGRYRRIERLTPWHERSILAEVAIAEVQRRPVAAWKKRVSDGVRAMERARARSLQQPLVDLPAA